MSYRNTRISTPTEECVQSIDGIEATNDGRRYDWFFYVNGSSRRWAQPNTRCGWRCRVVGLPRLGATIHVPAVVGSWPQPFTGGYDGRRGPVAVECLDGGAACARVRSRLQQAGAPMGLRPVKGAVRVLVGPWKLRADPAAAQIDEGVAVSGVFAESVRRPAGSTSGGSMKLGAPCGGWPRRRAGGGNATLRRATRVDRDRRDGQGCDGGRRLPSLRAPARPLRRCRRGRGGHTVAAPGWPMRSPFAYVRGPAPCSRPLPPPPLAYLGSADRGRVPLLEPAGPSRGWRSQP